MVLPPSSAVKGPVGGLGVGDGVELWPRPAKGRARRETHASQYRKADPRNRPAGIDKVGTGPAHIPPLKAGRGRPSKDRFLGRRPQFHLWLHSWQAMASNRPSRTSPARLEQQLSIWSRPCPDPQDQSSVNLVLDEGPLLCLGPLLFTLSYSSSCYLGFQVIRQPRQSLPGTIFLRVPTCDFDSQKAVRMRQFRSEPFPSRAPEPVVQ